VYLENLGARTTIPPTGQYTTHCPTQLRTQQKLGGYAPMFKECTRSQARKGHGKAAATKVAYNSQAKLIPCTLPSQELVLPLSEPWANVKVSRVVTINLSICYSSPVKRNVAVPLDPEVPNPSEPQFFEGPYRLYRRSALVSAKQP